jgi:hypothetical protein
MATEWDWWFRSHARRHDVTHHLEHTGFPASRPPVIRGMVARALVPADAGVQPVTSTSCTQLGWATGDASLGVRWRCRRRRVASPSREGDKIGCNPTFSTKRRSACRRHHCPDRATHHGRGVNTILSRSQRRTRRCLRGCRQRRDAKIRPAAVTSLLRVFNDKAVQSFSTDATCGGC